MLGFGLPWRGGGHGTVLTAGAVALSIAHVYKFDRLKAGKAAAKLFRLRRDQLSSTIEWRGWPMNPDAIVDPEGNETDRSALRNYQQMVEYFLDLAKRSAYPQAVDS